MNASKLKRYDEEIIIRYKHGESARSIAISLDSYDSSISYRLKICCVKKRSISEAIKGKRKSEEHRRNLSIARLNSPNTPRRNKHYAWKSGNHNAWSKLKQLKEFKPFRNAVLIRDNYTCRGCGTKKPSEGVFNLHHILPLKDYPRLAFTVSNGITLCRPCHSKTYKREYEFSDLFEKAVKSGESKPIFRHDNPEPSRFDENRACVETGHGSCNGNGQSDT